MSSREVDMVLAHPFVQYVFPQLCLLCHSYQLSLTFLSDYYVTFILLRGKSSNPEECSILIKAELLYKGLRMTNVDFVVTIS